MMVKLYFVLQQVFVVLCGFWICVLKLKKKQTWVMLLKTVSSWEQLFGVGVDVFSARKNWLGDKNVDTVCHGN